MILKNIFPKNWLIPLDSGRLRRQTYCLQERPKSSGLASIRKKPGLWFLFFMLLPLKMGAIWF